MSDIDLWLRVVLAVLATWRVTHLLANEDGPADILVRLRTHMGTGILGTLIDCFQCLSLWVAAPMALFITWKPVECLLSWLAISGAACLLERIGQPPVVMQPTSQALQGEVEVPHGMLWSETRSVQKHNGTDAKGDLPAARSI
jgi:hypothetical protein